MGWDLEEMVFKDSSRFVLEEEKKEEVEEREKREEEGRKIFSQEIQDLHLSHYIS